MPSLIPGYEYDIFISYRHKDNKYDGWVSEFVSNLRKELEATFKEDISIYFDENPHDGLLETHNVDKSLEKKLKCLIFIPILSQTYCDPKSFAWQHELVAFNKFVGDDSFGKHIKLENGNVASRILPVQIHEIDRVDRSLLEKELDAIIRPIEFIYKSSGVNRPLMPGDNPDKNINKTFYRDQINKVANAIKEITIGIKGFDSTKTSDNSRSRSHDQVLDKTSKKRTILFSVVAILVLIGVSYAYQYRVADLSDENTDIEKSIAVLPFTDMSPGKDQEYLGDGIAEEIITALSRIRDLKVIGRTSSFQFKGDKMDLRDIGEKLSVATVLEGSIQKSGNNVRITAQLINVNDGSHIWSERFDRDITNIFAIQDEIAFNISNKLKLMLFESSAPKEVFVPTTNMEAYEMVLKGKFFLRKGPAAAKNAIEFFNKAIALDPGYGQAYVGLASSYFFSDNREKDLETSEKAITLKITEEERVEICLRINLWAKWDWHEATVQYEKGTKLGVSPGITRAYYEAIRDGNPIEAFGTLKKIVANDPLYIDGLRNLGRFYLFAKQFRNAEETFNKILELDPSSSMAYTLLALVNVREGNYAMAQEKYKKAEELGDESVRLQMYKVEALAASGAKTEAKRLFELHKSKWSQEAPSVDIANIYFALGEPVEAFKWLEKSLDNKDGRMIYLRMDPLYDPYRSDPRFVSIMRKMNFPE